MDILRDLLVRIIAFLEVVRDGYYNTFAEAFDRAFVVGRTVAVHDPEWLLVS